MGEDIGERTRKSHRRVNMRFKTSTIGLANAEYQLVIYVHQQLMLNNINSYVIVRYDFKHNVYHKVNHISKGENDKKNYHICAECVS
jgi:hypothetical protein